MNRNLFYKIILIIAVLINGISLYGQNSLSQSELEIFDKIQNIRLEARKFDSGMSAAKFIENNYENYKKSDEYKNMSAEMKITVDNLYINAHYNCLYEADPVNPVLKTMMVSQYEEIAAFRDKNPKKTFNKYFYVSAGDLINSTMQFLPQAQAIKLGLQEKDDYDKLIKSYTDFSFGYINTALWYYFAPSIGGGSTKKAKEYFALAVQNASNNFEKYYSAIYFSQICYEEKDIAGCKEYLEKAENVLPQTRYITFIKMLNEKGYSLLYYTNNRDKVEKKLGLR